jgi:hypothetical protein
MIWVGWRQQRLETVIAAAMLAVVAAVAIPVSVHMASVYAHEGLAACIGNTQPGPCNVTVALFLTRFGGINILTTWSTLLPALAALLLAAPFLLDLDNGTCRLFWTQSITRRRWITVKLGLSVLAAVAVAGGLAALVMWSRAPLDRLDGRMSANVYDAEGIVPIAYALLALGVAVAIGVLWRRTVPTLLISFVAYVVGRGFMDSWLRQRLLAPARTTWLQGSGTAPNLNQALVIDQFVSDTRGHRLAAAVHPCGSPSSDGFLTHTQHLCAQAHAAGADVYMTAIYQPASRFWELQGVEFAIIAGTGALLLLLAGWWTHHRGA